MGVFGVLLLSTLDSSFLFLPFGNDLLLLALISAETTRWGWIGYVVISTIGSLIGVLIVDVLMRRAGEKGLERFLSPNRMQQLRMKMEDKGLLTLFLATVLPPPFPFTPIVMTAAALQVPRKKLLGVVAGGRLLRYTVEAMLALYFGRKIIRYLNSRFVVYVVYVLIAVALVGSMISVIRWLRSPGPGPEAMKHSTSVS